MAQDHTHNAPPSDTAMRVKALETLLQEKGLLDPAAIDALVETFETRIGPRNGARVVARAWTDPDYKRRLLADGSKAIAELGYSGVQAKIWWSSRTPTMCITWWCARYAPATPWPTLGLPPIWFKSAPTERARSSTRAACWTSSGSSCPRMSSCGSGTATRSCVIWCCRSGRPARTASARTSWRSW